jgi:tetratricopeptide (TPR) repeat protein
MSTKYFCAHCDEEFVPEEPSAKPRCPLCMRRGGVEPVQTPPPEPPNRRWILIALAALVAAAAGYGVYRSQAVVLEESVPLRPLDQRELEAYLERDGTKVGQYVSMFALSHGAREWPIDPAELATTLNAKSSSWSLERALPREAFTVDETLGALASKEGRVKLYPLELATAMAAILREGGARAMVAEAWEFAAEQTPADPSGMLGYYVVALYEGDAQEPSGFYDPWGGREDVTPAGVRVLRDTEAIAGALGIQATRVFARSGDGAKALPMVEAGLALDPTSPSLRVAHATVLVESGGLPQAVSELEAAIQLRADGPRLLNMAQLTLAQAGMLEANGQAAAAEAGFNQANEDIVQIVEKWPRYGRAHLIFATVHLALGDLERARVELEIAEGLSPESPMLWAVWAQLDLGREDGVSATAKINRALALDPENWQLRVQAAGIFYGAGDEAAARAQADEALRLVAPARRDELRTYLDGMLGSRDLALPELDTTPTPTPSGDASEPALMLGDPSKLKLRDPGEALQLDFDE